MLDFIRKNRGKYNYCQKIYIISNLIKIFSDNIKKDLNLDYIPNIYIYDDIFTEDSSTCFRNHDSGFFNESWSDIIKSESDKMRKIYSSSYYNEEYIIIDLENISSISKNKYEFKVNIIRHLLISFRHFWRYKLNITLDDIHPEYKLNFMNELSQSDQTYANEFIDKNKIKIFLSI